MRILWHIHAYPPLHNCGAEWMAHEINKFLIQKGHTVEVMLGNRANDTSYEFEGVKVYPKHWNWGDRLNWCNVVISHLDYAPDTVKMSRWRPMLFIAHNTFDYPTIRANRQVHVVYNSEAALSICRYSNPSIVLPPPIMSERFKDVKGCNDGAITLINLNENKGGNIFYKIAEALPEKKFIGVVGSYDTQVIKYLPNVEIVPNTPNIEDVYKRTSILLMPSKYESWGRTATEAAFCGIPVICTDTFGLRENMGSTGIYVKDRDNIPEWVQKINYVTNNWQKESINFTTRGDELNQIFTNRLIEFEKYLKKIANVPE